MLTPLKRLAERLGAAVVLVSHLTKAGSANGKHRVLGSIAYVGACRANHLFVADPRDPTGRRVLMLDNGGNVAAAGADPGLRDRGPRRRPSGRVVRRTGGPQRGQALRPAAENSDQQAADSRECSEWLADLLVAGPKPSSEVFRAALDAGYTAYQVKDAKHRIGAIAEKKGFVDGARWTWQLPEDGNGRHSGTEIGPVCEPAVPQEPDVKL